MIRLEDLLKMSWSRFEDVFKKSSRRLEDVWNTFLQDVLKTSWKRLEYVLARRLDDVLKTSWRRITKTNILVLTKTSWRRLLKTKTKDVFKTSSRRLHQDGCLLGSSDYFRTHVNMVVFPEIIASVKMYAFFDTIKILKVLDKYLNTRN